MIPPRTLQWYRFPMPLEWRLVTWLARRRRCRRYRHRECRHANQTCTRPEHSNTVYGRFVEASDCVNTCCASDASRYLCWCILFLSTELFPSWHDSLDIATTYQSAMPSQGRLIRRRSHGYGVLQGACHALTIYISYPTSSRNQRERTLA